jgi:hypothetical protein
MQGVFFFRGFRRGSARRGRGFRSSRIFDKVGSSEVVKTLQNCWVGKAGVIDLNSVSAQGKGSKLLIFEYILSWCYNNFNG